MAEAENSCLSVVRAGDKDVFLATLFAPETAQPHLLALHAFSIEVARVPYLVSEPQIGEIRLQWWADTLAAIATGEAQSHPVAQSLADTVKLHNLPIASLQTLIEAHRFDLYADAMPDVTTLEFYFGETQSVLFQLASMILHPPSAAAAATASGLAGVAFGLARALLDPEISRRLLPVNATRENLLALAEKRLVEARDAISQLPIQLRPAFLPLSVASLYLAAAQAGKTSVPQWRRQWRIWRSARQEMA
jgi:phytoene synthase